MDKSKISHLGFASGQGGAVEEGALGFWFVPGYSQGVEFQRTKNRDLVDLTFRSFEAGLAAGGEEEATAALREAFARRIQACLIDLPPQGEMADLPEEMRERVRQRQREALLLQEKRERALGILPIYSQLLQGYRAYDAELGSPRRIAHFLQISAATVLVGGVMGLTVERWIGLPYATIGGIGLGIVAFLTMMLRTLTTSRRMTEAEEAHTAALNRLKEELHTAFEELDRRWDREGKGSPSR